MGLSILQRYVLREILRVALLAFVALTAMMFVGMSVSLVRAGLSIVQLRSVIFYVIMFSLPYALPCSVLVGAVFAFGRMSGQNEITAISGSGVNVNHVLYPVLAAALVICVANFGLNHFLLPWSLRNVRAQRDKLLNAVVKSRGGQGSARFEIGKYIICHDGEDPEKSNLWKNVAIVELKAEFPFRIILAEHAHCKVDEELSEAKLRLWNAVVLQPRLDAGEERPTIRTKQTLFRIDLEGERESKSTRPKYDSLWELLAKRRELREKTAAIRASAEYAGITQPKAKRKTAERDLNRMYRERKDLEHDAFARRRAFGAAHKVVMGVERELRAATAARDAAAERQKQCQEDLASKDEQNVEKKEELTRLQAREGDRSRVRRLKSEIKGLEREIKDLALQMKEAAEEGVQKGTEIVGIEQRQGSARRRRAKAEAEASEATALLDAAQKEYERLWAHVTNLRTLESLLRVEAAIHFRNAGSLTSLIFILIGIPLGILSRRGNVVLAFAISFFAVLIVYYPLTVVAETLARDGHMIAWVVEWMPNVAVGGVGIALMKWGIRR